ncbi:unnamed protein product [Spirodela intermedia]|uniref:Uncharacterized protein n=1 Tax=Spirodela intermedia TaxID=51605 RepID=A0A7I8J886_SPIIN|nr:unnamed protein product [Spirodela intermedia]CAA6666270.1 unnamed protein product [Spirodela intermedia]
MQPTCLISCVKGVRRTTQSGKWTTRTGKRTKRDCLSFNKRLRLNTIQQGNDEEQAEEGINSFEIINCLQPTQGQSGKKLVYVKAQVDKEIVTAMVDSGATDNFISLKEA